MVEVLGVMIPIVALMIPIVAILTKHQQKMAQILNSRPLHDTGEVSALRQEIAELKSLVHSQIINSDGRALPPATPPARVE